MAWKLGLANFSLSFSWAKNLTQPWIVEFFNLLGRKNPTDFFSPTKEMEALWRPNEKKG